MRLPSGEYRALSETTGKSVTAVITPERGRALLATGDGIVFEARTDERGALNVSTLAEAATAQRAATREGSTRDGAESSQAGASASSSTATARGGAAAARGLEPPWITSLAVAGEKVLAGTRGRGLLSVEEGTMREVLTRPRPFFVEALARDAEGNVFLGAQTSGSDSGLFKLDAAPASRPLKLPGATRRGDGARLRRTGGELFVGTDGRGVFLYRGGGGAPSASRSRGRRADCVRIACSRSS